MSEIGTLAAWLPLLVPARCPLRRDAVRDTKSILALAKITLAPSPSDGVVNPDLPRMHQLNDERLKEFLPGTLLLTNSGEMRYVPIEDPIRGTELEISLAPSLGNSLASASRSVAADAAAAARDRRAPGSAVPVVLLARGAAYIQKHVRYTPSRASTRKGLALTMAAPVERAPARAEKLRKHVRKRPRQRQRQEQL